MTETPHHCGAVEPERGHVAELRPLILADQQASRWPVRVPADGAAVPNSPDRWPRVQPGAIVAAGRKCEQRWPGRRRHPELGPAAASAAASEQELQGSAAAAACGLCRGGRAHLVAHRRCPSSLPCVLPMR